MDQGCGRGLQGSNKRVSKEVIMNKCVEADERVQEANYTHGGGEG